MEFFDIYLLMFFSFKGRYTKLPFMQFICLMEAGGDKKKDKNHCLLIERIHRLFVKIFNEKIWGYFIF